MSGVLRQIIHELRRCSSHKFVRDSPMYKYVLEQYRVYQVTGAKHCKQQHEVKYLAETYLCLLESNAKQAELSAIYTRNEKTTEQAANLVGLRLPKEKS